MLTTLIKCRGSLFTVVLKHPKYIPIFALKLSLIFSLSETNFGESAFL